MISVGPPPAAARDQRRCQFAFAAITSGVVHGVIKRAPLARLRQVKQVMKKNKPLGRDRSFSDQTLGRTVSRFGVRGWRQPEQTQEQERGSGPVLCQPRNRVQGRDE